MMRLIILFLIPSISFSQKLINTRKPLYNMYVHSINILIDSVKTDKEKHILISGDPALNIEDWTISSPILNTETENVFKSNYNLSSEYKWLIDKDLIRIHLKDEYVLRSEVVISLFYIKTIYTRKRNSNMYEYGSFVFYYKFNEESDSFKLENIEKNRYN